MVCTASPADFREVPTCLPVSAWPAQTPVEAQSVCLSWTCRLPRCCLEASLPPSPSLSVPAPVIRSLCFSHSPQLLSKRVVLAAVETFVIPCNQAPCPGRAYTCWSGRAESAHGAHVELPTGAPGPRWEPWEDRVPDFRAVTASQAGCAFFPSLSLSGPAVVCAVRIKKKKKRSHWLLGRGGESTRHQSEVRQESMCVHVRAI